MTTNNTNKYSKKLGKSKYEKSRKYFESKGYKYSSSGDITTDLILELNTGKTTNLGEISYDAKKAIENKTLDSYKPKNDEEKKILDKYKQYTGMFTPTNNATKPQTEKPSANTGKNDKANTNASQKPTEEQKEFESQPSVKAIKDKYGLNVSNITYEDMEKWAKEHNFTFSPREGNISPNELIPKKDGLFGMWGKELPTEEEKKDAKTILALYELSINKTQNEKTSSKVDGAIESASYNFAKTLPFGGTAIKKGDEYVKKQLEDASVDSKHYTPASVRLDKLEGEHPIASTVGTLVGLGSQIYAGAGLLKGTGALSSVSSSVQSYKNILTAGKALGATKGAIRTAKLARVLPTIMTMATPAVSTAIRHNSKMGDSDYAQLYKVQSEYNNNPMGKGNIDLTQRPIYQNADGTISTVRSMTITENGKAILIPTIVYDNKGNAQLLSDNQAIEYYHQTGEHLGIFNSIKEADEYAKQLSKDQDVYYSNLLDDKKDTPIEWFEKQVAAGNAQYAKGLASSLDLLLPTDALGKYDLFSKVNDFYGNTLYSNSAEAQKSSSNLGKGWETAGEAIQVVTAALPNSITAMFLAGANVPGQAVQVAGNKTINAVANYLMHTAKNPQYWTSILQTLGTDYEEAKSRGANDTVATAYSIFVSAINAGIELGGIQALPDKLMGELAENTAKKSFAKGFLEWLTSSFEEGGEEVLQSFVSNVVAKIFDHETKWVSETDDKAVVNWSRTAKEFGMGTFAGMVLSGGQIAAVKTIERTNISRIGNYMQNFKDEVIAVGLASPQDTESYKIAQKLSNKKGKVSDYELGKLHIANTERYSVSTGDKFKDKKTGNEFTVVNRDEEKTTVEIETPKGTITKEFTNEQTDNLVASEQVEKIMSAESEEAELMATDMSEDVETVPDVEPVVNETPGETVVAENETTETASPSVKIGEMYKADGKTYTIIDRDDRYTTYTLTDENGNTIRTERIGNVTADTNFTNANAYTKVESYTSVEVGNVYRNNKSGVTYTVVERNEKETKLKNNQTSFVTTMSNDTADNMFAYEDVFTKVTDGQSTPTTEAKKEVVTEESVANNETAQTDDVNLAEGEISVVVDAINDTLLPNAKDAIFETMENSSLPKDISIFASSLSRAYKKHGTIGHISKYFKDGGKRVISAIEGKTDVIETTENVTKQVVDNEAQSQPTTVPVIETATNTDTQKKEEVLQNKSANDTIEKNHTTAYTNDNEKIDLLFKVVSVDDLIASNELDGKVNSNYPQELQPRDRSRISSQNQIRQMANDLNPARLAESTSVSDGSPIVGSDNVVESGNGRTLAIKLAYKNGTADEYRNYIINNAGKYGIDVSNLPQNPILIRERKTEVDRIEFTRKANESSISSLSATEQARVDAENLTEDVLNLLVANDDGIINTVDNKNFIYAVISKVFNNEDLNNVVGAEGRLSARGLERITNAIFYKAYGDISLSVRLSESLDNDMKNATKVLLNVAPKVVVIKNGIASEQYYDFNFSEDIANAVRLFEKCRNEKETISDYAVQTSFIEKESPLVMAMAYVFETKNRGAKQATEFYNLLLDTVIGMGSPLQVSMETIEVFQTKEEILDETIENFNNGVEPTNTVTIPESIYKSPSTKGRENDERGNESVSWDNTPKTEIEKNENRIQQDNGQSEEARNVADDKQLRKGNGRTKGQSEVTEIEQQRKEKTDYDVAYFDKVCSDIRKGENISLKDMRTAVDAILLNHGESIKAELSQLKNDELKKRISIYDRGRITKKADMVDSIYTDMLSSLYYAISGKDTVTYIYDGTGFEAQQSKMLFDISRELNEETFNKRLAENAEKYKKQLAEREEKLSKVKNPQTLEDFAYKKRYFGLSEEETIQYENLYAEERKKAREQKTATETTKDTSGAEAFFSNADNYTIEKTTHTKTGDDVWVVRPANRLETEEWKKLNEQMKALGGSYWRGNQGWNFSKDPTNLLKSAEETDTETVKGSTNTEKLRNVANSMQKAIDDKFRDRLTNTAKRAREAASAEAEGEKLKRLQDTINNIAETLENGENTLLDKIDSKAQVETLMNMLLTGRRNRISETLSEISYDERLKEQNKPYSNDDAKYAEYPLTKLHENIVSGYLRAAEGKTGYKQIADRLKKAIKNAKNDYVTVDTQMFSDIDKIVKNLSPFYEQLWNDGVAERKRLARMGIENVVELRAYLRDFINFLPGRNAEAEKQRTIKEKERQLANSKIEGFFPTPKAIVEKMLDEADIKPNEKVLEPSAGKGNIADEIKAKYPDNALDVVEWNTSLNELLTEKGHNVVGEDFLKTTGNYDKIVMNPPFEKGQDIDHIRHAYSLLNEGGRVVCIMSEGAFSRSDKKATEFREWLDEVGGVSEKLPEGSFKNSERSTGVNTRLVVIDKTTSKTPNDGKRYSIANDDFNILDFTLDELANLSDEQLDMAYEELGLGDLFESEDWELNDSDVGELHGGEFTIDEISEELDVEPEKIEILIRRKGLGESHIEENHTAVMTQERIDRDIKDNGSTDKTYAKKYITRISPKDFLDLTLPQTAIDREVFDTKVKGDHFNTMQNFDYESALRNEEQTPYLSIDRATGRVTGHNGRHRLRALEMLGIESVEIEVQFYDDDGYIVKYDAKTIPDMAISSQFDTAIETHISNIIPLNESHREEIERTYGEKAHANAGIRYSLQEKEGNSNEQRENLLSGNSRRANTESTRKQAERISEFKQKNKGKTRAERQKFAKELLAKGQTEEVIDGRDKYNLVKPEAYNDDMLSIVEDAKKRGKEVGFFIGEGRMKFDTKGEFAVNGIKVSDTKVLVRYDGKVSPQLLYKHEDFHTEWNTPEAREISNTLDNSLTEEEKRNIFEQDRYKQYMELYKDDADKTDKVWEEFVCDVMSGMNEYSFKHIDVVTDYWYGNESAEGYSPSTYTEITDAGGKVVSDNTRLSLYESGESIGYEQNNNSEKLGQFDNSGQTERLDRVGKMGYTQSQKPNTPHTKSVHRSGVSAEAITSSGLTAEQAALKEQNKTENMATEFYVKATENGAEQTGLFVTENTVYYPDSVFERNDISVKNGIASFTEKRFDDLVEEYSVPIGGESTQNYATGYVAYISPSDFLKLTAVNEELIVLDTARYGNLDVETLKNNGVRQGPYLKIDFSDGRVYGHEGRHRMVMLRDAGIEKVAIVIRDKSSEQNKYKTTKHTDVTLGGQKFYSGESAPGKVTLDEIIPLSPNYRNEVKEKFVDNNADIKYSLADDGILDLEDLWNDAIEQYGIIPKGEKPVRDVDVPQKISPDDVVSRFARTMIEAGITPEENVSDFEKAILDGTMTHEVITNQKASDWAKQQIEYLGFEEALNRWTVLSESGKVGKKELALGMELYNQCITNKDVRNAMKIAAELVAEATNAGQTLQSTRMLKLMTPDGQLYYLEKSVQKMNDEFREKLGDKYEDIELDEELMEDFFNETDEEKRNIIYDDICQDIADQIPATMRDKWNSWRYLAMLGNPRTHMRNILGNAVFVPSIRIKNYIGAVIEKAVNVPAEARTKSLHKTEQSKEFAEKDFEEMVKVLQGENAKYAVTGDIEGKRTIFNIEWLEKARLKNFEFLEKEDMWFLKMHYVDALARLITVRNIDTKSIDKKTLEKIRTLAVKEAQAATYRDANSIAEGLNVLQKKLERSNNKALRYSGILLEGVMPFKKTPLNIAKQGMYYSPLGILQGTYKAFAKLKNGKANITEVIDDFAKGLTGTGMLLLGLFLAKMGLLVGAGDKPDKEKAFDKMVGEQDYSINIGDWSYTIDWATPSNLSLFIGAELYNLTKDEFKFADIVSAVSTISEPLLELSVFNGVNGVIESAQYSEGSPLIAIGFDMATSYFMQALPTISGQLSRIIDNSKREYYYVDKNKDIPKGMQRLIGQASSKIPGASYLFEPAVDEWGREETYGNIYERVLENLVSPGYYSKENYTKVDKAIKDLYEKTGETSVLPIAQQKYYESDYVRYDMTAEEYTEAKKMRGQKSFKYVSELLANKKQIKLQDKKTGKYQNKYYNNMTDEEKVRAIKRCYEDAGDETKETLLEKIKKRKASK